MDIYIEACPLCGSLHSTPFLEARDFLVTSEIFKLVQCNSCSFLYTNPRPSADTMDKYYESPEYISHVKRDYRVKSLMYYAARYLMMHKKLSWIKSLEPVNSCLLDYGCGTGAFLDFLVNKNWDAWGIEPNKTARMSLPDKLSSRVFASIDQLLKMEFNIITLWHVLEHLHDIHGTLEGLLSKLTASGWLIVAVPNCASSDAGHYNEFWAGYDVPRHLSHFTPDTMNFLAKKHRLQLVKTIPLKLDAYYICMLSEKYRQGSTLNGIYQAAKSNIYAASNQANYSSLVYVLKK